MIVFIVKNHLLVESIFFVSLLRLHLSQKRNRYDNRRNIEGYSGNAGYKITGGTILGIGGGTSTPTSGVCTQRTVIYGGSGSKGTLLSIQGSDQVMSYTIPRAYSQMTLLFSSSKLASGTTYTIYTGGSVTGGTEFYGLTVGGIYTTGSDEKLLLVYFFC